MNVNVLQARNPYINNSISTKNNAKEVAKSSNNFSNEIANVTKTITKKSGEINKNLDKVNIISESEKKYFQKLFPENSAQIENHVVFNRSGKISETNVNKGSLFDRKI
jgi:hypothetical protein